LAHARSLEDTPSYCKDKERVKIRVAGEQIGYCDWVGEEDTEERCKTPYEKKNRNKKNRNKNGDKKESTKARRKRKRNNSGDTKERTRLLDARKLCTCTCAEYLPDEPDPKETLCPDEMNDGNCLDDGYQQHQVCKYNWVWNGCTPEELTCMPVDLYTCDDEGWIHKKNQIEFCEPPPRGVLRDELPEEPGSECQEGYDLLEELDPDEKLCPNDMNDVIESINCLNDGYQQDQVCEYNSVWSGCTLEELMCIPVDSYTCKERGQWTHKKNSIIQFCEEIRGVPRDELPEPGTVCQETGVDVARQRRRDPPSAEDGARDDLLLI
jgi:hypothetical protein